jgi:hypothetical protein
MPDTSAYLNLGILIVLLISGVYTLSLWLRLWNTERDMQMLDQLEEN